MGGEWVAGWGMCVQEWTGGAAVGGDAGVWEEKKWEEQGRREVTQGWVGGQKGMGLGQG